MAGIFAAGATINPACGGDAMPNGEFNRDWCNERHQKIDAEFEEVHSLIDQKCKEVWGERGFDAVWKRFERYEKIGMLIVVALIGNLIAAVINLL